MKIRFLYTKSIVYQCKKIGDGLVLSPINDIQNKIIKLPEEELENFKIDEHNHFVSSYLHSNYDIVSFTLSLY